jgi:hypothetical protein
MPGFIHTKRDEARWGKAKKAAGKTAKEGSESYWKLSNYIYHKMGKTEEDQVKAEFYKNELMEKSLAIPSISAGLKPMSTKVPNPSKVGSTAVKSPKSKKMPDPFGKPSLFFKSEAEEFEHVKHPTLMKLKDFLNRKNGRRQS